MKFNLADYDGNYAMHCKTEEEAKDFCRVLHEAGKVWNDILGRPNGSTYLEYTRWKEYKSDTCYNFNRDLYARIGYYEKQGYTILEWSDFMNAKFTKADLKTGDVILRRNETVEIVNRELGMLIRKCGWNDLDDIREDLTSGYNNPQFDIIAVRRPTNKCDCCFEAFSTQRGTLVYDRKHDTVEEMTLAEVCKLLGREIKIVKG